MFPNKIFIALGLWLLMAQQLCGQGQIPLNEKALLEWQSFGAVSLSASGKFASFEVKPNRGDIALNLVATDASKRWQFDRASGLKFSPNEQFAVFKISLPFDSIYQSTLRKEQGKKEDKLKLTEDTLVIVDLVDTNAMLTFSNVVDYKVAKHKANHVVFLQEVLVEIAPTNNVADPSEWWKFWERAEEKPNKKTDQKTEKSKQLVVINPWNEEKKTFSNADLYHIADSGGAVVFSQTKLGTKKDSARIWHIDLQLSVVNMLAEGKFDIAKLAISPNGSRVIATVSFDTLAPKVYQAWLLEPQKAMKDLSPYLINGDTTLSMNPHHQPYFTPSGNFIYLETHKKPASAPKDTLTKADKVDLEIWNWQDEKLQYQQAVESKKQKEAGYLVRYDLKNEQVLAIENDSLKLHSSAKEGEGSVFLLMNSKAYERSYSWDYPWKKDYYLLFENGETKPILLGHGHNIHLSPAGRYVVYYQGDEANWMAIPTAGSGEHLRLTHALNETWFDTKHDYAYTPFGFALQGFTAGDSAVILKSKNELWKIEFENLKTSCLTQHQGKALRYSFDLVLTDEMRNKGIAASDTLLISAFQNDNKSEAFFLQSGSAFWLWFADELKLSIKAAAHQKRIVLYTEESFVRSPQLFAAKIGAARKPPLSQINAQQQQYLWGTVELTTFTSQKGEKLSGLLYKPPFFDPFQKYPAIVYFYRLYSDELNDYKHIAPSRSIINPAYYASNGYVVFIPDVHFKVSQPGESSYDCVVSGTEHLIRLGFVDEQRIGIQGHSWGGYQVAYIVTKSDHFAAAMAGAPVSNMTSAYGGIRYESGMSRMFQYEKSQSRIGATLWENREAYLKNSPIFYAPQINTPLLIHHNDADGAVPYTQGLELFLALRRLNKPCWLLNYKGEAHNLKQWGAKMDFTLKLQSYFDYYLKNQAEPDWMKVKP